MIDSDPEKIFSEADLVTLSGLAGKIIIGSGASSAENFSDDTKSAVFIKTALKSAIRCPVCDGYLDPMKSTSYDHIEEVAKGGKGNEENCQLMHPYCNQSVKNKAFQLSAEQQ